MLPVIIVNKIQVDIIEVFDNYIIVQELKSKQIYTVMYYDLDSLCCELSDGKMTVDSNVISLSFYRKYKNGQE